MSGPLYFRYGGYTHAAGEITMQISLGTSYSPRGEPMLTQIKWTIDGVLLANTTADLIVAMRRLEAAYALQGQDAVLYMASGGTVVHALRNAGSLGGVRSMGISYPVGEGVELVESRTYSVVLEADYEFAGTGLLEFNETLSFEGTCGPQYVYLQVLNGAPEKQQVRKQTTQRATQSGSAVGYTSRPTPPAPLWPSDEHEEMRRISPTSPRVIRGRQVDFGVQWSYSFESATPLTGTPHTS